MLSHFFLFWTGFVSLKVLTKRYITNCGSYIMWNFQYHYTVPCVPILDPWLGARSVCLNSRFGGFHVSLCDSSYRSMLSHLCSWCKAWGTPFIWQLHQERTFRLYCIHDLSCWNMGRGNNFFDGFGDFRVAWIVSVTLKCRAVRNLTSCKGKVKVKCTLVQALRLCTGRTAHRGSRGIALLFHDQRH